jgi:hypothetical protein
MSFIKYISCFFFFLMYDDLVVQLRIIEPSKYRKLSQVLMSFIKYISYFPIILMYDDLKIIHAEVATKPKQTR